MPGLAETFSIYLGDYGVKAFAILLLLINLREIGELFKHSKIRSIIVVVLLLFVFRSFHATSAAKQQLLPLISLLWLIIIYLSVKTDKHFKIFVFCLYVSACIVLLSPGLERIFDFSRIGYTESRSEVSLIGIAKHYIIYAQMAIISMYLSLFYLIKSKSFGSKILFAIFLIISLVAIISSGSRGAIIAMLMSVGYLILKNKKTKSNNKFKFIILILISLSILFSFIPIDTILSYFNVIGTKRDNSSLNRMYLFYLSLESFYSAPLFGNGWDYIRLISGSPSHTLFFQLLAELGLLGLILECLVYYKLFSLFRSIKPQLIINDSLYYTNILLGMLFALGSWSLFENLGFVFGTRQLYVIAALIMCFYKINCINKIRQ